jgi:riboflavin biosynthesis pyrimidine reductase
MTTKIVFYPAFSLDGYIAGHDGNSAWVTEKDEHLAPLK